MSREQAEERIVEALAAFMREKLALPENRAKGGWADESPFDLLKRLQEETGELHAALLLAGANGGFMPHKLAVAREAADVACFAAMIVDVVGARAPTGRADARSDLAAARARVASLEVDVRHLKGVLARAQDERDAATREATATRVSSRAVRETLAAAETRAATAEDEAADLRARLAAVRSELEAADARAAAAEEAVADLRRELEAAEARTSDRPGEVLDIRLVRDREGQWFAKLDGKTARAPKAGT